IALSTGRPADLPELPLQYADYAAWQERAQLNGDLRAQTEWWKTELAGSAPLLELPTDRPRPAVPSHRAGSLDIRIPPNVAVKLRALSQREGTTLFMTLLAALQVLLHRYTDRTDMVVGSPVAGRTSSDLETMIGCFVNMLVLRTDLGGDPTFLELLSRVRHGTLAAYAHQDVPFERLVEELQVGRSTRHAPIFQVLFVLQNTPAPQWDLPGIIVRPMRIPAPAVRVDLSVEVADTTEGLVGTLDYSADLFDATTAARLLDHFGVLLNGVADSPGLRISDLPLLSPAEQRQTLEQRQTVEHQSAARIGPGDHTDPQRMFEAAARRTPDAIAVTFGNLRVSYARLNARANQIAHLLRERGVGTETRVAISGDWTPDLVAGLLGVLKAGGAFVPVDPEHPVSRLAFLRADSGVDLVLTQQCWRERHGGAEVICLDGEPEELARQPRGNPEVAAETENLAYIVYTSGSTGKPKGVQVTRRALASYSAAIRTILGDGAPIDGWTFGFLTAPGTDLSHTAIFPSLLHGGCLTLLPEECRLDGLAFAAATARTRLDVLKTTPTQLRALLAGASAQEILPTRWLILGGESIPVALWNELIDVGGCRLLNSYGPTEATVGCVTHMARGGNRVPAGMAVPIGRPLANARVYVLDTHQRPVPHGVAGELCIAGVQVARGYLGQPGLTAEHFVPDPYGTRGGRLYRTGDLARWTSDGELEFLGRRDQQVKVRGHRVELTEIEATLLEHPGVTAAAVTVWQPKAGDARVVAHVVGTVDPDVLRAFAATQLPGHMVPSAVLPLDALPLTASGKLDRKALPNEVPPDREAQKVGAALPAPGPTADLVHAIWAEVLRTDQIGPGTDFFDAGGHSLLAVQVVARVRRMVGADLPVRTLFEAPTLASFARRVDAARRAQPGTALPGTPVIRPAGRAAPIPVSSAQRRLWFVDQLDRSGTLHIQSVALNLDGPLAVPALRHAVDAVRHRHESLRTTFRQTRGVLEQVVAEHVYTPTPLVDLSALEQADGERTAQRLAEAEARRPFDLARGPLLRVGLVRLSTTQHVLLLTMHHLVTDAWSSALLFEELWTLYDAHRRGVPPRLPRLPVQYPDYAAWERRWLDDAALEKAASYWRQQLAGAPEALDLVYDRPLPNTPVFTSATVPYQLSATETRDLIAFSRGEEVTPYMTVLAAYLILLHRRTGQQDIVVGASTANRGIPDVERVIGFFTNQLVLRTRVSGDDSLRELLTRVREMTLDAYVHEEMPFDRLVAMLRPQRRLNRAPLYQAEIEFHRLTDQPPGPLGIAVSRRQVRGPATGTTLDLSLHVVQTETVLRGGLAYNADAIAPATARRMVGELRALLAVMAARPDAGVGELVSRAEKEWRTAAARTRAVAARARFESLTGQMAGDAAGEPGRPYQDSGGQ
ncbi:MAG TPA: amino acid adenylation domain-containing protein, partial [Mycobacteriales bacterium]|nr:amino acid adenylation domain-containing protein [Mycobacteriales bacterium]